MIKLSYQHKFNFLCNTITLPQVSHRKSVDINEGKMLPDIKVEAAQMTPNIRFLFPHNFVCACPIDQKAKLSASEESKTANFE